MTTKLERLNPALTALAAQVTPDARIRLHDGQYWLRTLQLTFVELRHPDGSMETISAEANAALAERILRGVLDARAATTDRWARQRQLLVGLHEEVVPRFQRGYICHYTHESLDDAYIYAAGERYVAQVALWDDAPEVQQKVYSDASPLAALEALWDRLAPAGHVAPWRARDVD